MNIDDLFKENYSKVYKYILSILRNDDDAQDVAQITFIQILNNISQYNEEKPFINWAMRVAHNCAVDFKRKAIRDQKAFQDYVSSFSTTQVVDHDYFEPNQLKGKYRFIYSLNKVCDMKAHEISTLLEMPVGTVAWILFKVKKDINDAANES